MTTHLFPGSRVEVINALHEIGKQEAEYPQQQERRTVFVAQIKRGKGPRVVYAAPELVHHAALVEMKQKQDQ